MNFSYLLIEQQGPVKIITFNRPACANALNYGFLEEIEAVAHSLREDAETRVVVFTGAGPHFSSGMDLKDASGYDGTLVLRRRRTRIGARAIAALLGIDQITIAAWNGAAMGGGACLATALDFRVGASDCFMQYPEIDIGMNLMWQSLPLITQLVGPARAKRLVAGGERVAAPTLLAWGVLEEVVAPNELLSRALTMADFYASKPPIPAQMIKQSVNHIMSARDHGVMHMDVDQNLLTRTTQDHAEALSAWLSKRPPVLRGD